MKMLFRLCFIVFLLQSPSFAQSSRLSVNLKQAPGFYARIKNSLLIVPLSDKPDKEDSALKAAVRKYWYATPYKFITFNEFLAIRENKNRPANYIYLIDETYIRFKYKRKDWAHAKFYLTPQPGDVEHHDKPFIEFKLPVLSKNKEVFYPDYTFLVGLMIKHYNYEVELMGRNEEYKSISRKSVVRADFKHELKEYAGRKILTAEADFENYVMNLPDGKKAARRKMEFKKYIATKMSTDSSLIQIVNDEEIKRAVDRNEKTLVYTGFSLYDAGNGKLLRRIDASSRKRREHAFTTFTLTGLMLAAATMVIF